MAERDPIRHFEVDVETGELIERLAQRLGLDEGEAIRRGLREFEAGLDRRERRDQSPTEYMADFWRRFPPGRPTGRAADKAFYDDLSGDL